MSATFLLLVFKLTWGMEYGYADIAVGVDVGVEEIASESHLGGTHRVVCGKGDGGGEHSVLVEAILRTW